jgi:hypothetical protein
MPPLAFCNRALIGDDANQCNDHAFSGHYAMRNHTGVLQFGQFVTRLPQKQFVTAASCLGQKYTRLAQCLDTPTILPGAIGAEHHVPCCLTNKATSGICVQATVRKQCFSSWNGRSATCTCALDIGWQRHFDGRRRACVYKECVSPCKPCCIDHKACEGSCTARQETQAETNAARNNKRGSACWDFQTLPASVASLQRHCTPLTLDRLDSRIS